MIQMVIDIQVSGMKTNFKVLERKFGSQVSTAKELGKIIS